MSISVIVWFVQNVEDCSSMRTEGNLEKQSGLHEFAICKSSSFVEVHIEEEYMRERFGYRA
jgi:hypothetical protein